MNPLRQRDFIEQFLKAYGERVEPDAVPPNLVWRTWLPCAQHLYNWHWAVHDAHLWGRLEDAHGCGGVWRVRFTTALSAAWGAISRHLGPTGVTLLAGRFAFACLSTA
jgi:hypothetical protein